MYTRQDYRADLGHKLLALEDGGYGDFEYEDPDLNLFLDLAIARLYPAIYRRLSETFALESYGTQGFMLVTPPAPTRVYRIEDAVERSDVLGWKVSGDDIIQIDPNQGAGFARVISSVNVYYHSPFIIPDDDLEDVGLDPVYKALVVHGALIEALESRQDTGVRGDPAPQGQFMEVPLLDRLYSKYEKMLEDLAMTLPAVLL